MQSQRRIPRAHEMNSIREICQMGYATQHRTLRPRHFAYICISNGFYPRSANVTRYYYIFNRIFASRTNIGTHFVQRDTQTHSCIFLIFFSSATPRMPFDVIARLAVLSFTCIDLCFMTCKNFVWSPHVLTQIDVKWNTYIHLDSFISNKSLRFDLIAPLSLRTGRSSRKTFIRMKWFFFFCSEST